MKNKTNVILNRVKVPYQMRVLIYRNRKAEQVLREGNHWVFDPRRELKLLMLDRREIRLDVPELRELAASELLKDEILVFDVKEDERLLLRLEGRPSQLYGPGLQVFWKAPAKVEGELLQTDELLFRHREIESVLRLPGSDRFLESWEVPEGFKGVLYRNGKLESVVSAGRYAAWKGRGSVRLVPVDCREKTLEISGQDIMTADRVTLRVNLNLVVRITDVVQALSEAANAEDAVYREAQLALRAEVGGRSLDELLSEKQQFGEVLASRLQSRAKALGMEICQAGLRDIILPGEMKEILNQVILAGKQAEANSIVRREETAAMRSQMNTAKLIRDNPTLMRLRELEVLERIAEHGKLNVVLGEKGLADRITNLL